MNECNSKQTKRSKDSSDDHLATNIVPSYIGTATTILCVLFLGAPLGAQQCSQISLNLELIPLRKIGECPIGFYEESQYCIPNEGQKQAAIRKVNGQCPFQFQPSGDYCLAPQTYPNFVIEQISQDCPRGWFKQEGFCIKECPPLQLDIRDAILQRLKPGMNIR